MVWDILIISLFFEKMRGKKGGSRREGEGGWVQVLSTSVSNDSTKFFSGYQESTVFIQVLLQIYFCFLEKSYENTIASFIKK